jgi:hypothetical protein
LRGSLYSGIAVFACVVVAFVAVALSLALNG